jgi:inosine-uridine nucleoside N-ribohydrolase
MGGTHSAEHQGGVEFNLKVDPRAAQEVFSAPWRQPIVMVGLDATSTARLTPADVEAVRAVGTAAALTATQVLTDLDPALWDKKLHEDNKALEMCEYECASVFTNPANALPLIVSGWCVCYKSERRGGLHALGTDDACAVAAWLRPSLLRGVRCHVEVDEVGRTLCDLEGTRQGKPAQVVVGLEMDKEGFVAELLRCLRG